MNILTVTIGGQKNVSSKDISTGGQAISSAVPGAAPLGDAIEGQGQSLTFRQVVDGAFDNQNAQLEITATGEEASASLPVNWIHQHSLSAFNGISGVSLPLSESGPFLSDVAMPGELTSFPLLQTSQDLHQSLLPGENYPSASAAELVLNLGSEASAGATAHLVSTHGVNVLRPLGAAVSGLAEAPPTTVLSADMAAEVLNNGGNPRQNLRGFGYLPNTAVAGGDPESAQLSPALDLGGEGFPLEKARQAVQIEQQAGLDERSSPSVHKPSLKLNSEELLASKISRAEAGSEGDHRFEELLAQHREAGVQSPKNAVRDNTMGDITSGNLGASTASHGRVQIPVTIHFSKADWSNMVADRTALMFAQNLNSAELQLDPPELGPIQVKVSVNQDQASVVFSAANPAVRESVDQSIARLRDLLSQQGLDLVNVDVSDQQSSSQQNNSHQGMGGEAGLSDDREELVEESSQTLVINHGIDSYV